MYNQNTQNYQQTNSNVTVPQYQASCNPNYQYTYSQMPNNPILPSFVSFTAPQPNLPSYVPPPPLNVISQPRFVITKVDVAQLPVPTYINLSDFIDLKNLEHSDTVNKKIKRKHHKSKDKKAPKKCRNREDSSTSSSSSSDSDDDSGKSSDSDSEKEAIVVIDDDDDDSDSSDDEEVKIIKNNKRNKVKIESKNTLFKLSKYKHSPSQSPIIIEESSDAEKPSPSIKEESKVKNENENKNNTNNSNNNNTNNDSDDNSKNENTVSDEYKEYIADVKKLYDTKQIITPYDVLL